MQRFRIAPTPSGYLHIGNGVNFLLTWLFARRAGGSLRLRIDDLDGARSRPEYVEDIFRQLDWLSLAWQQGPSGPDDFFRRHSQHLRLDRYRAVLDELAAGGRLFVCTCSRTEIRRRNADGLYPGTCRHRCLDPAGPGAVRIRVEAERVVAVQDTPVPLGRSMGDFVLRRRDGLPSYQLASLVDDLDHSITSIVRGADLLESSAAQLFLAECLGRQTFGSVTFHHHPLIADSAGGKLSKSDNALSLQAMREQGVRPAAVYRAAAGVLGLEKEGIETLADLWQAFAALGEGPELLGAASRAAQVRK